MDERRHTPGCCLCSATDGRRDATRQVGVAEAVRVWLVVLALVWGLTLLVNLAATVVPSLASAARDAACPASHAGDQSAALTGSCARDRRAQHPDGRLAATAAPAGRPAARLVTHARRRRCRRERGREHAARRTRTRRLPGSAVGVRAAAAVGVGRHRGRAGLLVAGTDRHAQLRRPGRGSCVGCVARPRRDRRNGLCPPSLIPCVKEGVLQSDSPPTFVEKRSHTRPGGHGCAVYRDLSSARRSHVRIKPQRTSVETAWPTRGITRSKWLPAHSSQTRRRESTLTHTAEAGPLCSPTCRLPGCDERACGTHGFCAECRRAYERRARARECQLALLATAIEREHRALVDQLAPHGAPRALLLAHAAAHQHHNGQLAPTITTAAVRDFLDEAMERLTAEHLR